MSNRSFVITVDLGGTNLRAGTNDVLARVLEAVQGLAKKAKGRGALRGVALGFPGIVDPLHWEMMRDWWVGRDYLNQFFGCRDGDPI